MTKLENSTTEIGNLFVQGHIQTKQGSSGPPPFQRAEKQDLRLKIKHFTADAMAVTKGSNISAGCW